MTHPRLRASWLRANWVGVLVALVALWFLVAFGAGWIVVLLALVALMLAFHDPILWVSAASTESLGSPA